MQISRGIFKPIIDQDIHGEGEGNFEIRTFVWHESIIYSHYTFQSLGNFDGLPASKVDSAKQADYANAEKWIIDYNKVR